MLLLIWSSKERSNYYSLLTPTISTTFLLFYLTIFYRAYINIIPFDNTTFSSLKQHLNICAVVNNGLNRVIIAFLTQNEATVRSLIQHSIENQLCSRFTFEIIVHQKKTCADNAQKSQITMQRFCCLTEEGTNCNVKALTEFDERTVKFFQLCLLIKNYFFSACLTVEKKTLIKKIKQWSSLKTRRQG